MARNQLVWGLADVYSILRHPEEIRDQGYNHKDGAPGQSGIAKSGFGVRIGFHGQEETFMMACGCPYA